MDKANQVHRGLVEASSAKTFSKLSKKKWSILGVLIGATAVAGGAQLYLLQKRNTKNKEIGLVNEKSIVGKNRAGLRNYTVEEVGKRDSKETGIWVTYKEGVYDITEFVDKHPGGPSKIIMAAGSSIEPFWKIFANHNAPEIYELLESMRIGNLVGTDTKASEEVTHDPYGNEPSRNKLFRINGQKPFCAEPPPSLLVDSYITRS